MKGDRTARLGKVASDLRNALDARAKSGAPEGTRSVVLAAGAGWRASDIICTAGPRDRAFEEQHSAASVAVVVAGSFQYRTARGSFMMTPGSLFLGNSGECFECGHEHAAGDRCVSFRFTGAFIERLAGELGHRRPTFGASRTPPARGSAPVIAAIASALSGGDAISWEEAAIDVAVAGLQTSPDDARPSAESARIARDVVERVTRAVRQIERDPSAERDLNTLAADAELSAFQFLRAFRRLTGTTPHQYLVRTRLREAAAALRTSDRRIVEIALACGFNDLSNFNHAFRAEFAASPREYRRTT